VTIKAQICASKCIERGVWGKLTVTGEDLLVWVFVEESLVSSKEKNASCPTPKRGKYLVEPNSQSTGGEKKKKTTL